MNASMTPHKASGLNLRWGMTIRGTLPFCGSDCCRVSQGGTGANALGLINTRHAVYVRTCVIPLADGWATDQRPGRSAYPSTRAATMALPLPQGTVSAHHP